MFPSSSSEPPELALLAAAPPSAAGLAVLAELDPAALSEAGQVHLMLGLERAVRWITGLQQAVLVAMATPPRPGEPGSQDLELYAHITQAELASALTLSDGVARERLETAAVLVESLPATRQALLAGDLDYRKAVAVVEAVEPLAPAARAAVEERVLRRAARQTLGELRRTLRRAALAADPDAAQARHERAVAARDVRAFDDVDGMGTLWARMTGPDLTRVWDVLDTLARHSAGPDDARAIDARRSDALVDVLLGRRPAPGAPRCQGPEPAPLESPSTAGDRGGTDALGARPDPDGPDRSVGGCRCRPAPRGVGVQVVISADTLLGVDDGPAELTGFGPITAEEARRLAYSTDATWRRLLSDPDTGRLLEFGRTRYAPPADLVEFVRTRDRHCRFPGCARRAERCDLDHAEAWDDGGHTCPHNLGPLCRRHHRLKTHGRWQLVRDDRDGCTWTSPRGRTYRVEAERHTDPRPQPPPDPVALVRLATIARQRTGRPPPADPDQLAHVLGGGPLWPRRR